MSEMEVRPSLIDRIRSIIAEHTIIERGARGVEIYVVPSIELNPIKLTDEGKVYGLRVVGYRNGLKEVFNYISSSSEPYLIESYIFSSEEPSTGIFLLNVINEERLWKIVKKLADIDGVEFIEIHGPVKSLSNFFANHWLFPPSIMGDKAIIIPRSILRDFVTKLGYDVLKDLIKDLARNIKSYIAKEKLDLDVIIEIIRVLGLGDIVSVRVTKNNLKLEVNEPRIDKNICLIYLELFNELLDLDLDLDKFDETSCTFRVKKH